MKSAFEPTSGRSDELQPLERYQVLNELGRGAISRVYGARDRSTGAVVALKILDPALFEDGDANLAEVFLKNARSAARLKHRNIVKVLDSGEAGGTAYVAMELVVGENVRQMLDKRPLSIARAIQILDDIASALAYAHEEGVVHRGVKPSNIIVMRSGVAKIGDFGIGQIGEAAVRYKSPEQVRGDPVDHRSDLFSLGTLFYEMLTHRPLFQGSSAKEVMDNILRAEAPAPSEVNPHVPGAVEGILSGMLTRNPDERFANARILLRELQGLKDGLGLGPGVSIGNGKRIAGAPGIRTEPTLRTPEKTSLPPRGQVEPAASPPPTEREPRLESDPQEPSFMIDRGPLPERPSGSRIASFATFALMLVAVLGVAVFLYYSPSPNEARIAASPVQEPLPALPAPVPAPPPLAAALTEPAPPPAAKPSPPAQTDPLPVRAPEQTASLDPAPAKKLPPAAQRTATISEPQAQPGRTAKLIIAVSPRGELYIDGKHYGTTPPITTLDLEPGMHRIEIRSGSGKPYLTYMTVQAGEERRIRHDFSAKSRPPI